MLLTLATVTTLAATCAPSVAPSTLAALAKVESGFDPLAIGVNGASHRQIHPSSPAEAVAIAGRLIAAGQNIDLGLGQINSANLGRLGLDVALAFDACANLEASGRLLKAGYLSAKRGTDDDQAALRTSLSVYNTGDASRGFHNGYVARVVDAASRNVPVLQPGPPSPSNPAPPGAPAWDVFAATAARASSFVFTPAAHASDIQGDAP